MIARELNTAVKSYLVSVGYDVPFRPFYADTSDTGPFVIYYEYPSTANDEQFFLQKSIVRYMVMSQDASEIMDIGDYLIKYLNVGDDVSQIKVDLDFVNPSYRLDSIRLYSGNNIPPEQKDGYSAVIYDFMACYVQS